MENNQKVWRGFIIAAIVLGIGISLSVSDILANATPIPPPERPVRTNVVRDMPGAINNFSSGIELGPNTPGSSPGSESQPIPRFSGINTPWLINAAGPVQIPDDVILHGLTDVRGGLINTGTTSATSVRDYLRLAYNFQPLRNIALNNTSADKKNSGTQTTSVKTPLIIRFLRSLSPAAKAAPALPDLRMTSITISPAVPNPGMRVSFSGTVNNQGASASGITTTQLQLDMGNDGWWDHLAGSSTAPLPNGASRTVVWLGFWEATLGTHKLRICANTRDPSLTGYPAVIAESNTTNNCTEQVFTVNPAPYTDLTADSLNIPDTIPVGTRFTPSGKVRNIGTLRSDRPINARFCVDAPTEDACLTSGPTLGTLRPVSLIDAGATVGVTSTAPWTPSVGFHSLTFCVNIGSSATESTTTNNCNRRIFTVTTAPVGLPAACSTITDMTVCEARPDCTVDEDPEDPRCYSATTSLPVFVFDDLWVVGRNRQTGLSAEPGNVSIFGTLNVGGNPTSTNQLIGNLTIPAGNVSLGDGNLNLTIGSIGLTSGNLTLANGNITAAMGSVSANQIGSFYRVDNFDYNIITVENNSVRASCGSGDILISCTGTGDFNGDGRYFFAGTYMNGVNCEAKAFLVSGGPAKKLRAQAVCFNPNRDESKPAGATDL